MFFQIQPKRSTFDSMNHYHYIFTGNGLSALLTLFEMMQSEQFSDKKILLIDADTKNKNDRRGDVEDLNLTQISNLIDLTLTRRKIVIHVLA